MAARIGIMVGSLRAGSFNQALGDCLVATLTVLGAAIWRPDAALFSLPLYHGDLEAGDFPQAARELKAGLKACDAIVFVSPEYNGSVSPLLKNAIDWASRPTDGEGMLDLVAFRGKPAALCSASIGPYGGVRACAHLRGIAQALQMLVLPEELRIGVAHGAFDDEGELREAMANTQLDLITRRLIDVTVRLCR